jgi:hypothetical protein
MCGPIVVDRRGLSLRAAVSALALLLPAASFAHHSISAGFDPQQVIEIEGELTAIRWQNPHILLTLAVPDGDGREVSWELEWLSANGLGRTGISATLFRLGDRIKVAGNPSRRGLDRMWVTNLLLPSQQELIGGSPRPPRWSEQVLRGSEAAQTNEGAAADVELGVFRVWSSGRNFLTRVPGVENRNDPFSFPLTPEGRAAAEQRRPPEDTLGCVPKSMPWIMTQPYPIEFVRQGETVVLKIEEYDTVRTIQLEPAPETSSASPSPVGHSVGRWEGSALVVTTTKVMVGPFGSIGGGLIPLSADATFVERFVPSSDGARLDYSMTITDPRYLTEPVTLEKSWLNVPGTQVLPYNCVQ